MGRLNPRINPPRRAPNANDNSQRLDARVSTAPPDRPAESLDYAFNTVRSSALLDTLAMQQGKDRFQALLEVIQSRKQASETDDKRCDEEEAALLRKISANTAVKDEKDEEVNDLRKQLNNAINGAREVQNLGEKLGEELAKLKAEREAAKRRNDEWISGMLNLTVSVGQHLEIESLISSRKVSMQRPQ